MLLVLSVPVTAAAANPILVITSSSNPYTGYLPEILRNEGLNEFDSADLSSVTSTTLSAYDIAILGDASLTSAQVTVFTNWVNGGGRLIAMHPDKQLAGLLGLTSSSSTLSNGYLLMNTSSGPGLGLVGQTIQFHGTADLYGLSTAASYATLYSNASTPTTGPAVTLNLFGSGQAAAFTYDLARSVVYTRQGNPAWSGETRDAGNAPPIRSYNLFYGAASFDPQPDWVDLSKVAIPQADEQQRLLANLILQMNVGKKPLPRFWYFPKGLKAAVIMTGDDHGSYYSSSTTSNRFNDFLADSPTGCNVANWECVRGTSYLFPPIMASNPLTNTQAASYVAQGFEIGVHVDSPTTCSDWTTSTLNTTYTNFLASLASKYPSLPAPQTHRMHCVSWSDYDSQPKTELAHGIRLDTTYYYWPSGWINDVPGIYTGSGMPMRFADRNGNLINVYQATSQMTDESGQSYPFNINTLLDNALSGSGYFGAFTANMHNDGGSSYPGPGANQIVASAQARGVPIVSALQMLQWLDGRNGSSFNSLSWSGNVLSFSVTVGTNANNLRAMLPVNSGAAGLTDLKLNGSSVSYQLQTIKGVQYAVFAAAAGSYQAIYGGSPLFSISGNVNPAGSAVGTTLSATGPISGNVTVDSYGNYAFNGLPNGTYTITPSKSSASFSPASQTVTITGGNVTAVNFGVVQTCPCSIWNNNPVPGVPSSGDTSAVEVGVRFSSDAAGTISAIRFYKGSGNTGTHIGNLWTNTGTKLATATFANETASGWQQVNFSSPVSIAANTTYVASYHTTTGNYSADPAYFANSYDNTPLHALQDGTSSANGVYRYGASAFPNSTYQSTNYWVDVVFNPTGFSVSGTISGSGGPGATVSISGPSNATAIADASGNYSFSNVQNGTYSVTPSQTGFIFSPASQGVTVSGGNATVPSFSSTATYTISGNISGPGGTGVTVTLSGAVGANTTTDSSGNYSFSGLLNGTYTVTPNKSGVTYTPTNQPVTISNGNVTANFATVTYTISGNISGAGGSGATVNLTGAASATVTADTSGNYSVNNLLNGSYTVTPSKSGFTFNPTSQPVTINNGNGTANFSSAAVPTYSISGTISGAGGISATVNLTGTSSTTATADASGNYTFNGVVAGSYTVTPSKSGYGFTPANQSVTVTSSNVTGVNFSTAVQTFTLQGTISGAGGNGATVNLSGTASGSVTADASGNYTFTVVSGTYTVTPSKTGYTFSPGSQQVTVNGVNVSGVSFLSFANCPCSLWSSSTVPGNISANDPNAVELGVRFTSDLPGSISGIRFYKGSTNTGTHTGSLWSNTGALLATATFTNETASGWQQVSFGTPVSIAANTVYMASYHTTAGNYSYDQNYFTSAFNNTPLHAIQDGSSGGSNGNYIYGATAFPNSTWLSSNYYVDVVFTTATTYSISGTISGAGGSGATVALTGASTASTTADASGKYSFSGLANGSYTVTPSKTGFTFTPANQAVTISSANATANFSTVTYTISGTLSGVGGNGATVNLTGTLSASTTADASGNYSFTGLINGSYTVTPSRTGFTFNPASQAVTISNSNGTANFSTVTYSISGVISGSGGNGATVNLTGTSTATVTADTAGNYTFNGLNNGSYTVTPSASGFTFSPSSQSITVNGANVPNTNFSSTSATTYSITGAISGPGGNGATVSLTGTSTATVTADASGNYAFNSLINGSYTVTPTKTGFTFSPASQPITINNGNGTANFSTVTYTITGTISGPGGNAATVNLTGTSSASTTADASGNYSFSGLINGSYTVTPTKTGFTFSPASQPITINNGNGTANFSTVTYTITGTISGPGGNAATVNLTGTSTASTTADASGNYSFSSLLNGSYTVAPSKTGFTFAPATQAVTISNANGTANFSTVTYAISGNISGPGGSGATVNLTGTSTASTTADTSGNYAFTGLINGSYTVAPTKTGFTFTPASQAVTISNANATAGFATVTYSISGNISGTGGSGATVNLTGTSAGSATADSSGNFTFSNLTNGSYTITPSKSGFTFSPASQNATISNANVIGISFSSAVATTFSISGTISGTGGNGATVSLGGAATGTVTADTSGNYTFTGLTNGSYTVTPTRTGFIFTPASQSITVASANIAAVNFTSTAQLAIDKTVSTDRSAQGTNIVSPTFSTTAANELLLAFISTDSNTSGGITVTNVTGGSLTWSVVKRTNTQLGTAEIWKAFAPAVLTNVSATAALSQSVAASITVVTFKGVDTSGTGGSGAIGATGSGNANPGAPTASLITTRNNSWVIGVGNDWDNAIGRTVGANQTLVHQFLAAAGDTFWVQRQNSATSTSGTVVTINDTAPTTDRYNLSICEVLPAP